MRQPIYLANFLIAFCLLHQFQALNFKAFKKSPGQLHEKEKPVQVSFDDSGVLTIDGTVGGTSDPIVVDRKPLTGQCGIKPYYVFTACPKEKLKMLHEQVCTEGIIFCYDGQLVEGRVKNPFVLPKKPKKENKISDKCKEFNGFKLAIHYLPKTEFNAENNHTFLEVATSYMDESYYFPLPNSKCIELYLGSPDNILTSVRTTENDNKPIRPVQVWLNSTEKVGKYYPEVIEAKDTPEKGEDAFLKDFETLPDYKNEKRFADKPHLNMLYMDFRAQMLSPQMMMAIVPEKDCNMVVRVRSNVLKTCKTAWKQKNFALRAYNNNQTSTEYALTIESGTEDWKTTGRKQGTGKSQSESTEEGKSTVDETSTLTGLQKETEHVSRQSDSHSETSGEESYSRQSTHAGASAGGGYGPAQISGGVDVEHAQEQSNGFTDNYERFNSRMSSESSSETTITSNSQIMETAYKTTSSTINTQKKQTINSQTVGINKVTKFKWIVKVPPGKVMIPLQKTLGCDGQEIKIPWMRFKIQEEGEELQVPDYEEEKKI